jgi:hypothetical protein
LNRCQPKDGSYGLENDCPQQSLTPSPRNDDLEFHKCPHDDPHKQKISEKTDKEDNKNGNDNEDNGLHIFTPFLILFFDFTLAFTLRYYYTTSLLICQDFLRKKMFLKKDKYFLKNP